MNEDFRETLDKLESVLDKIPGAHRYKNEVRELKRLLVEKRNPRFAVVGRRGSGKSSLINAIFGEKVAAIGHETSMTGAPVWRDYSGEFGALEILDTRGFQEGSTPDEKDDAETPLESVLGAFDEKVPDAILFLVKATEVDAAIDGDLDELVAIRNHLRESKGSEVPVVAIVTQCDQLEPPFIALHDPDKHEERDYEEKVDRVRAVVKHLVQMISGRRELMGSLIEVFGVCAYMSWRDDDTLRFDGRWRINDLLRYLIHNLPDEAQLEFARLSQVTTIQAGLADRITTAAAIATAGIAATPIPVADILPITGTQVTMICAIGYLGGRQMSLESARDFLAGIGANVGLGFGLREAARALAKLIPVGGEVVSAAVAGAGTYAVGKAATAYFIHHKSKQEAAKVMKNARKAWSGSKKMGTT